jgi:REP element-mobilizing transposase RayT
MEHYRERYRCIVYAYVLMSNHVHLLIETGAVGLSSSAMRSAGNPAQCADAAS